MTTRPLFALVLCGMLAGCVQSPPTVPVEERGAPGSPAPSRPSAPAVSAPPAAPAPGYPVDIAPLPAPEAQPRDVEPAPPLAVPGSEPSGALLALLEQAEASHQAGQTQQALSQLERAQRIAPREPLVYLQLARLRLDLGDRLRAEQLARKGLSLSSDSRMRRAFETLLRELAR